MKTCVLGLGDGLVGDAGSDVEVVDLGTPGTDQMSWFFDAEQLVIVDTVKRDAKPGTLRVCNHSVRRRSAPEKGRPWWSVR